MSIPKPSVEEALRKAILRSPDHSIDARNRIYLAAREAIEQLPRDQAEPAMHTLFEAVTKIETEYAELELVDTPPAADISQHDAHFPVPDHPSRPAWAMPDLKLPELQGFTFPWKAVLVVIGLLAVMALSGLLVWQQFREEGIVGLETDPSTISGSTSADAADDALVPLFEVSGLVDAGKLSQRPNGQDFLSPANPDSAKADDIQLALPVQIYSREPIRLEKGRFYLFRMRLRLDPANSKVIMSAGFSVSQDTEGDSPLHSSFIAHQGEIDPAKTRKDGKMLVFSKLFEWADVARDIPLADFGGLVRPTIILESLGSGTRIWFNSLSVDAI